MLSQPAISTERQRRELEYHVDRAQKHRDLVNTPFSFEVVEAKKRRWWNGYWSMYSFLLTQNLRGKKVLVVGCGFGEDAMRISKMGAEVEAFDLSPDSLEIATKRAERESLKIGFRTMPAEKLDYNSNQFDCVVASDILHHVDIPDAMREIVRVSKPGALFVANEIYTHSATDRIRHSSLVQKALYPSMRNFIYKGENPYITEDERKLTEQDVNKITKLLKRQVLRTYFNFLVTRIVPDSSTALNQIDRILLCAMRPVAPWLAGRVLLAGIVDK